MTKKWLIHVDRTACIGAGACAAATEHFALDGEYRSYALNESVAPSEEILRAAHACPADAISVRDAETGESVYP
jgi:ferredoxin